MSSIFDDVGPEDLNFQKQAAQCHEALGAAITEALTHFEPRVVIGAGFAALVQAYKDNMPPDFTKADAAKGLAKMLGGYYAQIFEDVRPAEPPCLICGHIGHHDPRCSHRFKN